MSVHTGTSGSPGGPGGDEGAGGSGAGLRARTITDGSAASNSINRLSGAHDTSRGQAPAPPGSRLTSRAWVSSPPSKTRTVPFAYSTASRPSSAAAIRRAAGPTCTLSPAPFSAQTRSVMGSSAHRSLPAADRSAGAKASRPMFNSVAPSTPWDATVPDSASADTAAPSWKATAEVESQSQSARQSWRPSGFKRCRRPCVPAEPLTTRRPAPSAARSTGHETVDTERSRSPSVPSVRISCASGARTCTRPRPSAARRAAGQKTGSS